jgi:hypothetical protein
MTCRNCEKEFEGKYCPACGQKSKTGRITVRQVINDLRDQVIHFDRGFLYTIRELATRPGHSMREYLEGKRVKHVKPIRFLVWATAIAFLANHYLGFQERLLDKLDAEQKGGAHSRAMGQKILDFASAHPSLLMLMTIPTLALVGFLFFRKQRYNYAEMFTVNSFLMAEMNLLGILSGVIIVSIGAFDLKMVTIMGVLQWGVWSLYFGWAYSQFLNQPKRIWAWIKGISVLFLGYGVMILLLAVLVAIIIHNFKPQIEAWLGAN